MQTTTRIDSYADEVARLLRLPRRARAAALADLRGGLRAAALDLGAEGAVHSFGPPPATAERLEAEYGDPFRRSWLPFGLSPGTVGARARAAIDPTGPWFVPRVVGIGWDLNLGRLARALGLVGFDDLDGDVAAAISASTWRWALAAVSVPAGLAVVVATSGMSTMTAAPAHRPLFGPADRWASPSEAFAPAVLFAVAAQGLALTALWPRFDLPLKLALVGFGSAGAAMALSAAIMTRWFGHAPGIWSLLALAAGAVGAAYLIGAIVRTGRDRVLDC
ncbi:MAG: hypothetical protein M0Z51_04685 [Propionibacterium sp.]|nr:hypothetical protein [Propionibacterium sp.]